jgi:hypothetical protein
MVFSWSNLGITTLITDRSSGKTVINFEARAHDKSGFRTDEIGNHASHLVTLSIATEGSHLGLLCGKAAVCGIHIGVDRNWVATFRTADRLLRYIPTIYHQCFTCYERGHIR